MTGCPTLPNMGSCLDVVEKLGGLRSRGDAVFGLDEFLLAKERSVVVVIDDQDSRQTHVRRERKSDFAMQFAESCFSFSHPCFNGSREEAEYIIAITILRIIRARTSAMTMLPTKPRHSASICRKELIGKP